MCDDGMSDKAASVVCRHLGLGGAGSTIKLAPFRQGNGTIWLSRVRCRADEKKLEDCPNAGWGNASGCSHAEDVGISCLGSSGVDVTPSMGEQPLPFLRRAAPCRAGLLVWAQFGHHGRCEAVSGLLQSRTALRCYCDALTAPCAGPRCCSDRAAGGGVF